MPTIDAIEEMDIIERDGVEYLELTVPEGTLKGAPVTRQYLIEWDVAKRISTFVLHENVLRDALDHDDHDFPMEFDSR